MTEPGVDFQGVSLFERDGDLERIDGALRAACGGAGTLVVIEGLVESRRRSC